MAGATFCTSTAEANADQPPQGRMAVWRWVFLCSQTALLTQVALLTFYVHRYYYTFGDGPWAVGLLVLGTLLLEAFLLFASPFFFRQLGRVAFVAWISALAALVWAFVPVP